jgi:hypothetical protein
MNANKKIKAAQRENERWVLRFIRSAVKQERRWVPEVFAGMAMHNAVTRLVARGVIRYVRTRAKYGFNSGYEEVA